MDFQLGIARNHCKEHYVITLQLSGVPTLFYALK